MKLSEVILQQTAYKQGMIGFKLLEWLNRDNRILTCCLTLRTLSCVESISHTDYLAQNNVLIKRDFGWRKIYDLLAACMRKLITARACLLANARKVDHSIPLHSNYVAVINIRSQTVSLDHIS